MKTARIYKILGASAGGGVLLQTTGCDPTALTSEQVTGITLLIIDFALNALFGGII